ERIGILLRQDSREAIDCPHGSAHVVRHGVSEAFELFCAQAKFSNVTPGNDEMALAADALIQGCAAPRTKPPRIAFGEPILFAFRLAFAAGKEFLRRCRVFEVIAEKIS